jgi:PAS domain S-box-containing protein
MFRGAQTQDALKETERQLQSVIEDVRLKGQTVRILADASALRSNDVTKDSRRQAREMLEAISFDKAAVCGNNTIITLAEYLARLGGKSSRVQFFRTRAQARQWLAKSSHRPAWQAPLTVASGVVVMLIGLLALLGWQFNNAYLLSWIPGLRPLNPVAALTLILVGAGSAAYSVKKLQYLRWLGAVEIAVGSAFLLTLPVDLLLYHDQVVAFGAQGRMSVSEAVCFIAIGVVALVANHPKWYWRRTLDIVIAASIGGLGLFGIYNQLYARDWSYDMILNFVMPLNLAVAFIIIAATLATMLLYTRIGVQRLAHVSRLGLLIVIVLVLIQAATYGAWWQATARNKAESQTAFETHAHAIEGALQDRFISYVNLLHGVQGLFIASSSVNQGEFEAYYNSANVQQNYPGLRSLSFISKVNDSQLPAFIQSIRTDKSLHPSGNPTFTITSRSALNQHYIITYIAHSDVVGGTDLGSEQNRLAAFQQAEAQHRPVASGTIKLSNATNAAAENGFFITVPIAYENAPDKVIGFVNAVFDYRTFFANTFDSSQPGISIGIHDAADGKQVLDVDNSGGENKVFHDKQSIIVANRTWDVYISGTSEVSPTRSGIPIVALIGGQVFSLLFIVIFLMQARKRNEALNLVQLATKDLQAERNRAVASDQKSRAILSSIADGVFSIDTDGHITVFNEMAGKISGYRPEEALGRPYNDILRFEIEETGKPADKFIKKALQGHLSSIAEHVVIIRKDGKYISVANSAAPIYDTSHKIIGAIIVFRDVTKENQLEKAKAEFVSLTSHQLRTPLSAIHWYSEMLMKGDAGKLTRTQSEYVKEIYTGSNRMGDLVNMLLDASRLEIDSLSTKPVPTDMAAVIVALSKEFKAMITSREQTLRSHVNAVPPITADPRQLRMVVLNLISNAIKYTQPHGTIDVTLRVATDADIERAGLKSAAPHWFLSVKDSGYGIPRDDQPKIFGKLFRADNARALNIEGTGLGLFMVKQLVEKMGGHVWFESIETVGTTFYVVAPIETRPDKK